MEISQASPFSDLRGPYLLSPVKQVTLLERPLAYHGTSFVLHANFKAKLERNWLNAFFAIKRLILLRFVNFKN